MKQRTENNPYDRRRAPSDDRHRPAGRHGQIAPWLQRQWLGGPGLGLPFGIAMLLSLLVSLTHRPLMAVRTNEDRPTLPPPPRPTRQPLGRSQGAAIVPQTQGRSGRIAYPVWLMVAAILASTVLLRAVNLGQSWDIFVDEITYLRLAQSVGDQWQINLYGKPFFLHPPVFFILEALYLQVVHASHEVIPAIYAVRYLNVGVAALSAALVFVLGRRAAGWQAGLAAAAVFALDPFVIRLNSRNLIDTSAVAWVLLGYALLLPLVANPGGRRRLARQLAAGVAFGLALLSKDMTAFVTLLPLEVLFLLGWALPRRDSMRVALVAALTYLPYPILVILAGQWSPFAEQKFRGLLRLSGAIKETGFQRAGGPSFTEAIVKNFSQLGTTYVLLGLGAIAIVILLLHRDAVSRLLAIWAACAYALLAYAIGFGTLEEQFFYYLVVPAIVVVAVATHQIVVRHDAHPARKRALAGAIGALAVVFTLWSGGVWYYIHTTPDNTYEHAVNYMARNIPRGTTVEATGDTSQFLLDRYFTGFWKTTAEVQRNGAKYAIVNSQAVSAGYRDIDPELVAWITRNGTRIYHYEGRSSSVSVYRLPAGG